MYTHTYIYVNLNMYVYYIHTKIKHRAPRNICIYIHTHVCINVYAYYTYIHTDERIKRRAPRTWTGGHHSLALKLFKIFAQETAQAL